MSMKKKKRQRKRRECLDFSQL